MYCVMVCIQAAQDVPGGMLVWDPDTFSLSLFLSCSQYMVSVLWSKVAAVAPATTSLFQAIGKETCLA